MGFFDFLKGAPKEKEISNEIITEKDIAIRDNFSKDLVPSFEIPIIPEKIRKLMWIVDGKYKNCNPDENKKVLFENELFRIEYFGCPVEPSAIFTSLPVSFKNRSNQNESIGYFPTYKGLSPGQRWTYLEWLCDIKKPIDIGYVFIFYYGLERHLVYGDYKEAMDAILLLRQYHKNNSFQSYSNNSLIMSAVLHKDKEARLKILEVIGSESCNGNLLLIAKYLMRVGLSEDEIILLSNKVGFKNKRFLKSHPDLFKEKIRYLLNSEFEASTFPFYNLEAKFGTKEELIFANISFPHEIRSPILPLIKENEAFKMSIHKILSRSNELVKRDLADRKRSE